MLNTNNNIAPRGRFDEGVDPEKTNKSMRLLPCGHGVKSGYDISAMPDVYRCVICNENVEGQEAQGIVVSDQYQAVIDRNIWRLMDDSLFLSFTPGGGRLADSGDFIYQVACFLKEAGVLGEKNKGCWLLVMNVQFVLKVT